ncbi:fatty acid desaturase [Paracrocinitomix mangrovi]|uniref:fatty acid desaturase n=1 Tax=Paracrocinitomix mangrovi TaxID=2862509 RepID=UPI001C8D8B94|nr:fatty acid desaturase [Paracrocinitomix mangrovi]UKN02069.1 fatty acid desaturase [Paracrocinitomix mangrovi]
MEEKFHKSTAVEKEAMLKMMVKSNLKPLLYFLFMYGAFLAASILLVWSYHQVWWWQVIAFVFFAIVQCSMFAGEHETVHNTAFKSKSLNYFSSLMLGLAHMYAPSTFRDLHFTHHRYTHVPGKDPEISLGHKEIPSVILSLPTYLAWLSGLPLLLFKVFMLIFGALGMPNPIRKFIYPFVRKESRLNIALESLLYLFIYTGLIIIANFFNPGVWYLFIGLVVGHCLLSTYLVMEHNGLPYEGNILEKTRSMRTNKAVKFLMWNMPYHAEHHAYPAVPFYNLPQLHKALESELKHKDESHADFHLAVFKGKYKKKD